MVQFADSISVIGLYQTEIVYGPSAPSSRNEKVSAKCLYTLFSNTYYKSFFNCVNLIITFHLLDGLFFFVHTGRRAEGTIPSVCCDNNSLVFSPEGSV